MRRKICLLLAPLAIMLGSQAGASSSPDRPSANADAKDPRPMYYTREIDPEKDLEGRSLRELSLLRNTIYARAGNPFRKKWLKDYFAAQPWYHAQEKIDPKKLKPIDLRNADVIANYDAFLTRDQLLAMWKAVGEPKTDADRVELQLLSLRLGKWLGGDDSDRTPLEDPAMLDKQITVEQLDNFSRRDLRLLRNMIYARRGRPFHSELLQQYFGGMEWYHADPKYTDARLTALDQRNIKVVRSVEDKLGGPLTDIEHKQEEGWFANA